jgi:hypothetical protein
MFYYCFANADVYADGRVFVSSFLSDVFQSEKECVNDAIFHITEEVSDYIFEFTGVEWFKENCDKINGYFTDCETMDEIDTRLRQFYKNFNVRPVSDYLNPPTFDLHFTCT